MTSRAFQFGGENGRAHASPRAPPFPIYDLIGVSEPVPFGVFIAAQVPLGTFFQALPWSSTLEVPAQVVPGPAAQSFLPRWRRRVMCRRGSTIR
jgi:hypothetical protein